MEYTRNPSKNGKADIDEEVGIATSLQKDSQRREEEGEEVETDVRCRGWRRCHCCRCLVLVAMVSSLKLEQM